MIRADTTAPVVKDEEKLARATTQAHKAARDGYRFDVGMFAIWAGCDSATTLVAGARHVRVLHLLLARGLNRLRRKWRHVVDQLRVVLVHAPDVSARTAIVRDIRVLARERQIGGGVLPTRRTGRSRHVGKSSFPARNVPAEPQAICATLRAVDSFVTPKSWEVIPFVSLEGVQTVPPVAWVNRCSHPEVTFAKLKGSFIEYPKKTLEGRRERLVLLAAENITFDVEAERLRLGRNLVSHDDIIDAVAMLVSARHIRNDAADVLGNSERDARGLLTQMWV